MCDLFIPTADLSCQPLPTLSEPALLLTSPIIPASNQYMPLLLLLHKSQPPIAPTIMLWTHATITEKFKQQVFSAVNPIYYQDLEDGTFGYADVHIPAIITHLTTTYGTLTASDLKINRDKLTEAWNPDDPIENLWKNIKIVRAIATQGGEPISNGTTIQLTLLTLGKTGVHSHAIET
jgi:hypothetical protein